MMMTALWLRTPMSLCFAALLAAAILIVAG